MSIILLLASFMAITGYIINISSKHKALKSISESDYWLKKPWKWIFEAVMFLCGGSLIYTGLFGFGTIIWMLIIGGSGISMVGIFSRFKKNKFFKFMHTFGATIGFGALALSFAFSFGAWWYSVIIALIVAASWMFSRNQGIKTWNTEILLIYSVFPGLLLLLLFLLL